MPKGIPKNGKNKGWFKKGESFWLGKKRETPWLPKFKKNNTPWNKGKKGVQISWIKGKHHSKETLIKLSVAQKRRFKDYTKHPMYKNGKTINSQGYIFLNREKKFEHRFIVEQSIGRRLTNEEVIHHKNGIKTDNRIENLEILSRPEHIKEHPKIIDQYGRFKKQRP